MNFREKFSAIEVANLAKEQNKVFIEDEPSKNKAIELFEIKKNIFPKPIFPKFFKIKTLLYLLKQDKKCKNSHLLKFFIKRPFYYSYNLLKSYLRTNPYVLDNDVFLFKMRNINDLQRKTEDKNALFVFGFSYCQKPKDCPVGKFTPSCSPIKNSVCLNCFIGKCFKMSSNRDQFLVIPDIYYISVKLTELIQRNPKKEIVFVICSCYLSIKMFLDFANMVKLKGVALPLINRVCLNYKSFLFAEKGKKNGITDISEKNKDFLFNILKIRGKLMSICNKDKI